MTARELINTGSDWDYALPNSLYFSLSALLTAVVRGDQQSLTLTFVFKAPISAYNLVISALFSVKVGGRDEVCVLC